MSDDGTRPWFARQESYDGDALDAAVNAEMANYKPPEITLDMIGVYVDPDQSAVSSTGGGVSNPHRITLDQLGITESKESIVEEKEQYIELFELLEGERAALQAAIQAPPITWEVLHELNLLIVTITRRVAPLYQQGKGMARADLELIDRATEVLAEVEEKLATATQDASALKGNLQFLYSGGGTLH